MKKIVSLVLLVAMLMLGTSAMAETSDIKRFADYTDVDLNVFINKGYSCYYNDFEFSGELSPVRNTITWTGTYDDTYSIQFDIKVLYSAGSCILIPRMIFNRSGMFTYFDDRMSDVYIRNGGNRYRIDVSGCSRSSSSKNSTATDNSVEPMFNAGRVVLEDLALYPQEITVKIGSADAFVLTPSDKEIISDFYVDCQKAGIFNQAYLNRSDDYYIRTLFNENTVVATENAIEEGTQPDSEQ